MQTTPGQSYCVNVLTAPVEVQAVYADGTIESLKTLDQEGQYTFIAMSAETRFIGGEIGKQVLPVPFNSAPVGNGNGGGGTSPSPLDPAKPLANGKVYTLTVTEATDLSALTVEDDATAEIWLSYSAGSVTWPATWVWGTDTFNSADPDASPDFTAGEFYCIVVRHYSARGIVIATLSHTVK